MKTPNLHSKLLITATLLACALAADAKIWRVNGNPGVNADFTTVTAAISGASVGDTIIIEPLLNNGVYNGNMGVYGWHQPNKLLKFFGSGYYLDKNDSTQSYVGGTRVNSFYFIAGSGGSEVWGLEFTSVGGVSNNANNITFGRCLFSYAGGVNNNYEILSLFSSNHTVTECYFSAGNSATRSIYIYGTNNVIVNNIIPVNGTNISMSGPASAIIANNVFGNNTTFNNSTISNNIFKGTSTPGGANSTFNNNLFEGNPTVTGSNNQFNVDMATVFIGGTHPELQYTLKAGSPAIGAAHDGDDCGAFGGLNPYKLSGMPPIPAIFYYNNDAVSNPANNTLGVRVKAKGHN